MEVSRARAAAVAVFAAALLAALLLALAPRAGAATKTLADDGFRSDANGYSFANYGAGYAGLTPADMVRLYGVKVCESYVHGSCRLLPTARRQMATTNESMQGGHCMGFASTAQAFFEGIDSPQPFGAPTVPGLELKGNEPLQSHIAYAFSFQYLPAVQRGTVSGTPAQVLQRLRQSLRPGRAPFVIGILDQGGGHAITPIAVDATGPNQRAIRIYDNNWPGEIRTIHVDLAKNTWSYELFPGTTWSGNAQTKSLKLLPFERGFGHHPCPFCDSRSGHAGKLQLEWHGDKRTGDHSDLFVADRRGRRSGCGGKGDSFHCVNRIPGVQLWQPFEGAKPSSRNLAPLPTFRLPPDRTYRATLSGHPKGKPASEGLTLTGHGFAFDVHGIELRHGERSQLGIAQFGHLMLFRSGGGPQTPRFEVDTVTGKADYAFRVHASRVVKGAQVGIGLHTKRHRLLVDGTHAKGGGHYTLTMARLERKSRTVLAGRLRLRPGKVAVVHYGRWRHGNHPPVTYR